MYHTNLLCMIYLGKNNCTVRDCKRVSLFSPLFYCYYCIYLASPPPPSSREILVTMVTTVQTVLLARLAQTVRMEVVDSPVAVDPLVSLDNPAHLDNLALM